MMHFVENPDTTRFESMPDIEIWDAFQNGDKEALELIYRRHISDLYNYGMKIKGNEGLVKDCIQELFIELWYSKENLSPTDNIKYYMLRSLKLKINHHLKKELRYSDTIHHLNEEFQASHEAVLIRDLHTKETAKELASMIKKLPPKQQEVLHLLFYQELSYKKVSEMMAINVRSVYTLAWKSLGALRKKMHSAVMD